MIDISNVANLPGVYILKDKKGKVLYVGKAKNLKNRLKSHFQHDEFDQRKAKMIELVKNFSYIVTSNELEALVLEANLIKQYKPPFNVLLRDDKSYPYLRITMTEEWPKIEVVRKPKKDGNLYFGPYVPAQSMWEALSFIRKNFSVRTCKYSLSKPIKPCIQYQMKRCPAPCARLISREDYMKGMEDVIMFLKGQKKELIEKLRQEMLSLSKELKFEQAGKIRDQIKKLERIFEQQRVVSANLEDMDIIGIFIQNSKISVNILFVRNCILIGSKDYVIKKAFYENASELTHSVIEALYSKEVLIPPKLIILEKLPEKIDGLKDWLTMKRESEVQIRTPCSKEEKDLLDMALNNARIHLIQRITSEETLLQELKERLEIKALRRGKAEGLKIGAFDVSTLFGAHSVGSFIYWQDGSFNKNFYRHLKIKETEGIDDYSAMKEIVLRVIKKFWEGEIPTPDLILIDGGKGHLNTVLKIVNELKENLNIFAIAKDPNRLILQDGKEILLEDKKPSSLLLRKIRDEAHRFAISYHKKLRKKATFVSILEKISGVGTKRRLMLLKHFGSISKIKEASPQEIASLPGFSINLANKILEALNKT